MGVAPPHSVFARQETHLPPLLQSGVGAAQPAFDVQPLMHLLSPLQSGVPAGQSPLDRHWTQSPSAMKQSGAAVPQWLLPVHATHWRVTGSHKGRPVPAQSMSPRQPTHWPLAGSHFGSGPEHTPALLAHEDLHVASRGQHAGALAGQSALAAHVSHEPRTHRGELAGHCALLVHSTQPSVTSQTSGAVHPDLHAPPVPGPPGPGTVAPASGVELPHATARMVPVASNTAAEKVRREVGIRRS